MKLQKIGTTAAVAGLLLIGSVAPASATILGVSADAALEGSFGMRMTYNGVAGAAYVQDNSPAAEDVYFVSFLLDPSATTMTNSNGHQILQAFVQDDGLGAVPIAFRVNLFRNAVGATQPWAIHAFPRKNDNTFFTPRLAVFVNAFPQQFGFEFRAGTGPNNGIMRVYRAGVERKSETTIDNSNISVGMVRFGAPATPDSSAGGVLDLDAFVSTRTCQFPVCP